MITNEFLTKRYKRSIIIFFILGIVLLYLFFFYHPGYYAIGKDNNKELYENQVTGNTIRIYGDDFYKRAVSISQMVYDASCKENKPNGVILVRGDRESEAILAARLIHDPINAPILYVEANHIPSVTLNEIKRLEPRGIFLDGNRKVILVGDIKDGVKNQLTEEGIKFRHIKSQNIFDLGKKIDSYLSALRGNHKDKVIVSPIEMLDYALVHASWNAHVGDGFLFISKDSVPKETSESLKLRYGGAYIYLLGDEKFISDKTKAELIKHGHVQKIPGGKDIYSQSIGFASFSDIGKNSGSFIKRKPRILGWGISEAGHNFIFVNPKDWQSVISASLLSYKGECGPIILVEKDKIPKEVEDYLKLVKPMNSHPKGQIFNKGVIIGSEEMVTRQVQLDLDNLLR